VALSDLLNETDYLQLQTVASAEQDQIDYVLGAKRCLQRRLRRIRRILASSKDLTIEKAAPFCVVIEDLTALLAAAGNDSERQRRNLIGADTTAPGTDPQRLSLQSQLQALLREQRVLSELLVNLQMMLGFKGKGKGPPGGKAGGGSGSGDGANLSIASLREPRFESLRSVFRLVFGLLVQFTRGNSVSQLSLAPFIGFIQGLLVVRDLSASDALSAIFRDNRHFLLQDISDYVASILQLIRCKGPLPQFIQFLIPLCTYNGVPLPQNQSLIGRALIGDALASSKVKEEGGNSTDNSTTNSGGTGSTANHLRTTSSSSTDSSSPAPHRYPDFLPQTQHDRLTGMDLELLSSSSARENTNQISARGKKVRKTFEYRLPSAALTVHVHVYSGSGSGIGIGSGAKLRELKPVPMLMRNTIRQLKHKLFQLEAMEMVQQRVLVRVIPSGGGVYTTGAGAEDGSQGLGQSRPQGGIDLQHSDFSVEEPNSPRPPYDNDDGSGGSSEGSNGGGDDGVEGVLFEVDDGQTFEQLLRVLEAGGGGGNGGDNKARRLLVRLVLTEAPVESRKETRKGTENKAHDTQTTEEMLDGEERGSGLGFMASMLSPRGSAAQLLDGIRDDSMNDLDAELGQQMEEEMEGPLLAADEEGDFGYALRHGIDQCSSVSGRSSSQQKQQPQQPSSVRWISLDQMPKDEEQLSGLQYYLDSLKLLAAICRGGHSANQRLVRSIPGLSFEEILNVLKSVEAVPAVLPEIRAVFSDLMLKLYVDCAEQAPVVKVHLVRLWQDPSTPLLLDRPRGNNGSGGSGGGGSGGSGGGADLEELVKYVMAYLRIASYSADEWLGEGWMPGMAEELTAVTNNGLHQQQLWQQQQLEAATGGIGGLTAMQGVQGTTKVQLILCTHSLYIHCPLYAHSAFACVLCTHCTVTVHSLTMPISTTHCRCTRRSKFSSASDSLSSSNKPTRHRPWLIW
jgi:hypothetical protein